MKITTRKQRLALLTVAATLASQLSAQTTLNFNSGENYGTPNDTSSGNNLTVNIVAGSANHNGVISGDGSVTKNGNGSINLTQSNTYSGGTLIEAGTLGITNLGSGDIATKTDSPTAIVPFSITVNTTAQPLPVWLRIQRSGFVFDVFRSTAASPSEADWTPLASIDMYRDTLDSSSPDYKSPAVLDKRMHYGMFINSGSQTLPATASFTDTKNTGKIIYPAAGTR